MHVLHLLVAPPVLGHTLGRPTTLAPEGFECSKCGERDGSGSNCCFDGGAWEGMCEEGGQHTYSEGFQACNGNPYLKRNEEESRQKGLTRFSTAEKLNEMFRNAVVGNDLEKVGLLFHGFEWTVLECSFTATELVSLFQAKVRTAAGARPRL